MTARAGAVGTAHRAFDRFTRSSLNYRLVPFVDVTGAAVFVAAALVSPAAPAAKASAIVAGLVAWIPLEYSLHRWLGHGPPSPARRGHAMHHSDDVAPVAAPMFVVPGVIIVLWSALALLVPAGLAAAFLGGVYVGYNYYTLVHHVLHHCEPLAVQLGGATILHRHRLHHANHDVNFGVTSSLCDRLLGTFHQDTGGLAPAESPAPSLAGPHDPRSAGAPVARLVATRSSRGPADRR